MAVYIAYHREYPFLTNDPIYQPLHVGKALSSIDLGFEGDNTGDHISEKNRNYSELTGLYWIWKNTSSEIVGLSHYRRFFFYRNPSFFMRLKKIAEKLVGQGKKRFGVYYSSDKNDARLILNSKEINEILSSCDAIIPMGRRMKYSVWEQYKRRHLIKDLDLTGRIIAELFPSYLPAFEQVMQKKELFSGNMFVMKKASFNDYMEWLFTILFELEKQTDISSYDPYQKRLYGFISERLLDVWITKQKLQYKKLPVLYFKKL